MNPLHRSWCHDQADKAAAAAQRQPATPTPGEVDLVGAARGRLQRLRHMRQVARAGGEPGNSVNRAEWRAQQARECIAVLAQAAQARSCGAKA